MQKMKQYLYNRIIKDNSLSNLELKLIFWLAAHQDERGRVQGIYYSSISEELDCSISGFYLTRDSLCEKGYIEWDKSFSADMDIILYDNNFMIENGEIEYRDYVDLNISIFNDKEFLKCKAGAIRTAMYFIKRVAAQGAITMSNSPASIPAEAEKARKLWFNQYKSICVLKKLIGVTGRMIKEYIKILSKWIDSADVQKDGTTYTVFTVLKKSLNNIQMGKKSYPEREAYRQKIKTFIRRNKIRSTENNLEDTADLIFQYRNKAKTGGLNITEILYAAINNTCSTILNSINVHKSLRAIINYNCPGLL